MKKLIALVLAVLMVASMAAMFSFADDPVKKTYDGTEYTQIGGYVKAGGLGFYYNSDGKPVLGFDIDGTVKSKDFWENADKYTFTVVFSKGGSEVGKQANAKLFAYSSVNDTDNNLYFVAPFTPTKGESYTYTIYIKGAEVAYFVEEAEIPFELDPVPEAKDLSGELECTEGKATYKYDKKSHVLTITGDGAAVIKRMKTEDEAKGQTDYPFFEVASVYATKVVFTGLKEVPNCICAHYGSLETAIFGEGIETIWNDAVAYDNSLKTVYVPKTLTAIKQGVLYSSNNVEKIYYAGTADQYKEAIKTLGGYNDAFGKKNQVTLVNEASDKVVYNTPVPTGDLAVIATIVAVVALAAMAVVVKKVRV